jgi:mRNA interferase RelE/StbE
MAYDLRIEERVIKEMAPLEAKIFRQLSMRIFRLSQDPRPHDSEQLKGYQDPQVPGRKGFRIDQGEYRILYTIDDRQKVVIIFRLGHRREVYR